MVKASIDIYLNKQTKEILLLNLLNTRTGWITQGNFFIYEVEEFKTKGWDTVLQAIENQPAFDPNDRSELDRMNSARQRKFDKEHKTVSLDFETSGEIYLMPIKKVNKYGGGIGKEKIFLTPPITNESFLGCMA